jgi:hypothetical protein
MSTERNTSQKTFGELKRGDEIYLFCGGRTQQRMQVVNIIRDGNRVYLKIKPTHINRYTTVCFVEYAPVEVCCRSHLVERATRYEPQVLSVIQPGMPSMTLQEIRLLIKANFGSAHPQSVSQACLQLTDQGQLIQRARHGYATFRRPLPQVINLPVVELQGTKSARAGWVVQFGKRLMVQWVDGIKSLSDEALLEPLVDNPVLLRQVQIAQTFAAGETPDGFIPVPAQLVVELSRQKQAGQLQQETLLEISKALNIAEGWHWRLRNQILDYLDLYYPGWQRGVVAWQLSA